MDGGKNTEILNKVELLCEIPCPLYPGILKFFLLLSSSFLFFFLFSYFQSHLLVYSLAGCVAAKAGLGQSQAPGASFRSPR